jgi:small GTP-binding protein
MSDLSYPARVRLRAGATVALVGNPNCGKTALFNLLTGARQKVANYAGVTVERKFGTAKLGNGSSVQVIDLPGTYSLTPATPDERITLEVIEGQRAGEAQPDLIVAVVDATNLRMNLRLVLELKQLGRPMVVALNMADVAQAKGLAIDMPRLSAELGCPHRSSAPRAPRRCCCRTTRRNCSARCGAFSSRPRHARCTSSASSTASMRW